MLKVMDKKRSIKPVLRSGHSKIDKTKILMTNGSLMQVESIAESSPWSILQYFWPALSDNINLENQVLVLLRAVVLNRINRIYIFTVKKISF